MLWSIGTCQNKVSTDQYHMSILQVLIKSCLLFLKLTVDVCRFLIGLQALVRLTCCKQRQVVQKLANTLPRIKKELKYNIFIVYVAVSFWFQLIL